MKTIFYQLLILIFSFIYIYAQPDTQKIVEGSDRSFMAPAWSPDGSHIAFTSDGYKGIWIINYKTKEVKKITDEPAAGFGFKWSDNSEIILARVSKYEGIKQFSALKTFNIKTGESNLLTEYRTDMGIPHFSPDNEKVIMYGKNKLEIFDSGIETDPLRKSTAANIIVYLKNDKIAVENLFTGDLDLIEPVEGEQVMNLQLSPDGKKVTFEIYGGNLYVMNIDGTGLKDLGKGYRPEWSPDGQFIVYMITEDDGHQITSADIFTIRIDGTEKTNHTNTIDRQEMNPSWSPDGKKIAFDVPDEGAIYVMELKQ